MKRRGASPLPTILATVGYFVVPVTVVLFSPWWLLLAIVVGAAAMLALTRVGR